MIYRLKILSVVILITAFVTAPVNVYAQVQPASQQVDLVNQVKQAKTLLEPVKLNYALTAQKKKTTKTINKKKVSHEVISHYTLDVKDLAVAVLDPATMQIAVTVAMQRGKDFEFPDKNFSIQRVNFNGVNSQFKVHKPAGGKVLALKYLITPVESGSKASIEKALYPGIYVPYSPELLNDNLADQGSLYLDRVLLDATKQLANVPSVSQAGKTVPQAIDSEVVRALIYAEHMDTSEFLLNPNTAELVKKVNVLLAGNEGDTWKYSVSSAGASGISQFIPSTYAALVKRHPEVNLMPDFVQGMRNHVNAVKATFLLLDDYVQAVRDRAPEHFIDGHTFDYAVAAYNGGPARVANAAKQFGANWFVDQSQQLPPLEKKVSAQQVVVNNLTAQFKKTKAAKDKAAVQKELNSAKAVLSQVVAERDQMSKSILRNETVHYTAKIHRLVQIFNDRPLVNS